MAITAAAIANAPGGLENRLAHTILITVPEADAINVDTAFTFAALGLGNFGQTPEFWMLIENTGSAVIPVGATDISVFSVTTTGFHIQKTSVAAGAVSRVYFLVIYGRPFTTI